MPVKAIIKPPGPIAQAGGRAVVSGVGGQVAGSFAGPAPSTSAMQFRKCGCGAERGSYNEQ